MSKKFKVGDKVRFQHQSEFTGHMLSVEGLIVGTAKDVKAKWPEECGALTGTEPCYLVVRKDQFGNDYSHMVWEDEIEKEVQ